MLMLTVCSVSGVLSHLTLSLCCHFALVSQYQSRSQDQDTGSLLTECSSDRSQSIDLSRGMLKALEFGQLINTEVFSD